MHRLSLVLWALLLAPPGLAEEPPSLRFASPDGRFVLRIIRPADPNDYKGKADLVERESGKVVVDLANIYLPSLAETTLVWSADSRWVAFGTRIPRDGDTKVYAWDGSTFVAAPLPDDLPRPSTDLRKVPGKVSLSSFVTRPLRWRKPGTLELERDEVMVAQVNRWTYTGTLKLTVAYDAARKATLGMVGRTRTTVQRQRSQPARD